MVVGIMVMGVWIPRENTVDNVDDSLHAAQVRPGVESSNCYFATVPFAASDCHSAFERVYQSLRTR